MTPLDLLIIGGGMYVTGRGAPGYKGTVLPAVLEARRAGLVGRIAIATTSPESAAKAGAAARALAAEMGVSDAIETFPGDTAAAGPKAFESAAREFGPDAVIVSVPDHLHAEICIPMIEAGRHCLVVKPMAGTLDDAKRMVAAASAADVVAQVEFHKRLDESNLMLREAVQRGELGDPLYASIEYSQRKLVARDALRGWAAQSNIFQYLGVHYVDLLSWATSFVPVRVTAWGQKGYLQASGVDTWDSIQVVVEWRRTDGQPFVSTHVTNWIDPDLNTAMSDQKINLVGTKGRYQADQKNRGVQTVSDEAGVRDLNPYFTTGWRDDLGGHVTYHGYGIASVMQFLQDAEAVSAGRRTAAALEGARPTFKDGLVSTAVIEAAAASLAAGSVPVAVPAWETDE
jgi:predicted dehydrogenase